MFFCEALVCYFGHVLVYSQRRSQAPSHAVTGLFVSVGLVRLALVVVCTGNSFCIFALVVPVLHCTGWSFFFLFQDPCAWQEWHFWFSAVNSLLTLLYIYVWCPFMLLLALRKSLRLSLWKSKQCGGKACLLWGSFTSVLFRHSYCCLPTTPYSRGYLWAFAFSALPNEAAPSGQWNVPWGISDLCMWCICTCFRAVMVRCINSCISYL